MRSLNKLFSLEHRTVLVTGATGYLGRAMVWGLAELGARVLINGRREDRVNQLVAELQSMKLSVAPAVFDVNDEDAVHGWFDQYGQAPLTGLVNNAYAGRSGTIETSDGKDYWKSYETSVVAAHRLLRHALGNLRAAVKEHGSASVVNIASMYGLVSPDLRVYASRNVANPPYYGAAKAALLQWTRYAACEFGGEGIRVNSISPGPFPSEIVQESNPRFVSSLASRVPIRRVGKVHEIQGPVSFLISDAASYVNGANIVVDGGWTCW